MANHLDISILVPSYNEDESLPELCSWIKKVMDEKNFAYEVVIVDDGSTDRTWEVTQEINAKDKNVKGIKFNRNYGKSAALNVGFKAVKGDVVITMDADLQDSPDEIPALYDKIMKEGYDLVSGWKKKRYDPISKTVPSKFFNAVTRKLSGIELNDFNCGLKAYKNAVVKNVAIHGEMHRYIPVIAKWRGFDKIGEQVVEHRARQYGVSKFGLERFINGFLDLLSITFVTKFRKKPMHFFGLLGTLSFMFGFVSTLFLIWEKWINLKDGTHVREIVDQPFFYIALVMLVIGVQLFLGGFLAEMITMNGHKEDDYLVIEEVGND
ncbi:glycosyltransferase family 2 protein [Aureibacter tunicatorum]|uniref:Glycosyltransferase involved in cell wall biosynthesis n=1 Tax=Aureibacter tunicatorum TaxID=866807 RepID=A0AAE3XSK2_9BACT|nr:glycosyltransferase family 2 protein [Aureibacter tunicatorum]MDR6241328.1 glycosyltransferase involved in cell wall biosynthesis [Aureibacter tunicatorum]BDD03587.1 glycosyl transferase family 2 [Aureibacter tunicatorum]